MDIKKHPEAVKLLTELVHREISMIICGDIEDDVNIENVFKTFDELPSSAQDFIINNIYVPKNRIKTVSISDMAEMQEYLISRKSS